MRPAILNSALTKSAFSRWASGSKLTTSIAASVPVATMRMPSSGAVGGREEQQVRRRAGQELPRGPGTDQEPHDQAEIVAGDVHQVALVQVLAAAQPGPAHAAAIEGQGEAALDQLGPELERFPGHARAQPGAVVVDRPPGLLVAVPAVNAGAFFSAIRLFQAPSSRSFSPSREW